MRVRPLLILTGIVSAILGATVVYLVLSVPNDLRADSLLKDARKDLEAKKNGEARQKLVSVVQQYPRTDAAAAATVALITLAESERQKLERDVNVLRTQNVQQTKLITDLQKNVTAIQNKPAPVVTVQAPEPKPAAKKTTPKKKPTPKRRRR
jgi:TolA-binding protein